MANRKAVVFDLGKVLLDFDYGILTARMAPQCRISRADLARIYTVESELMSRYESGLISTSVFFERIRSLTGFSGSEDQFGEFFADIFTPIVPMIALQGQLKERGIPTFLLSNTNALAIDHVYQRYPFIHGFDAHIFSHEHHSLKPDAGLYAALEKTTGYAPEELIYVDDRPENVEAGRLRGWTAVLHESPERSIPAIESWLNNIAG